MSPAVVTTESIAEGKSTILLIIHDSDFDGGWQLYDGSDVSSQKAIAITKVEALVLDPSIAEATDIPVGWQAERLFRAAKWVKKRRENDA